MIEIPKNLSRALSGDTFVDLFAGIGSFRYALQSFGAKCVLSSEIDRACLDVYEKNHGERPSGDITKIPTDDVPDHDILCAGHPCQSFSISGKQRGFEDERGVLFWEIHRIAKEKRPKIILLENVRNLETHDKKRTMKTIRNSLVEIGYRVRSKVLNSSNYGVPQSRERTFTVCVRDDVNLGTEYEFPEPTFEDVRLRDILVPPEEAREYEIDFRKFEHQIVFDREPPKISAAKSPFRIGQINSGRQGERVYHPDGHAITLSSGGGGIGAKTGLYRVGDVVRRLTPRECARLTGLPEEFAMHESPNQCYVQFGNSVVVDVVQRIVEELVRQGFVGG
jgi:DNA (cytosine-5)-methyltransferase 1